MTVRFQSGPIFAILALALGVCPVVPAQRGSGASAPVAARPASSGTMAPRASSTQVTTSSHMNVRASAASGFAHPSQWQSVSNPINRHKPPQVPNPPTRSTPRVTGYYLFYGGAPYWVSADNDQAADQAPVDEADADQTGGDQSADQSNQSQSRRASMQAQQIPANQDSGGNSADQQSATEQDPLPDEGEFTLVMTDGTWIQAVAFTHSNDKIVYITAAGSRYTIAASELDADSTLRVNQERGTPLQSPL